MTGSMVYLISQGVADPNHLPTSIPRLLNLIEASENGFRHPEFRVYRRALQDPHLYMENS